MIVQLRPLTFADVDAVHEWAQRAEVCRYQTCGPNTPDQTRSFVRAAVDAWSSRPQCRFVYAIDMWGRRFATDAARQLLDKAFTKHKLHRVFATCDPRNTASGRVLVRVGMTYEGRMRETILIRDGWRDSDLYAILEWEYRQSTRGALEGDLNNQPSVAPSG